MRHGQNEDNANGILNGHRDLPLTPIGEGQAHEIARGIKLSGITFKAVYTTPLFRGQKTAEIVCEELGLPAPIILDLLIERDFGTMAGKPTRDIEKLCSPDIIKTDTVTYFLSPPGAETFPDLFDRAGRALDWVRQRHQPDEPILLSTHGDLGKMAYGFHYGIPWLEMLTKFHFGNCELLLLSEDANPNESHVIRIEQHNH